MNLPCSRDQRWCTLHAAGDLNWLASRCKGGALWPAGSSSIRLRNGRQEPKRKRNALCSVPTTYSLKRLTSGPSLPASDSLTVGKGYTWADRP